ncbi:MAG TPA: hypothetical protein VLX56_06320, partial [Nitrososphaerales archaeon]|nr:hypothetical protein [Nitrososphaerales archaeon]
MKSIYVPSMQALEDPLPSLLFLVRVKHPRLALNESAGMLCQPCKSAGVSDAGNPFEVTANTEH